MIKKLLTGIVALKKQCEPVSAKENVTQLIADLKDTLGNNKRGWGLSANQIGVLKQVSYIKMPKKINSKDKSIEYFELLMINPKIVEKQRKVRVNAEECISLPGLKIDTDRYVFITIQYEDEKRQMHTDMCQDMEALCIQHEIDHLQGRTILDRKHRRKR